MLKLARFSIRRPKTALAGWVVLAVLLSVLGISVDHYVSPQVSASKTQSYAAQQLADAKFGASQNLPILLEGPKAQLDKQGPKLVAALTRRGNTRVLSAWDGGSTAAGLRPKPTAALIIASVPGTEKQVIKYDQPRIKAIISQQVTAPVKAYLSGAAALDQASKDQSVQILQTAAVIAIGVLFVMLLVGLRAPARRHAGDGRRRDGDDELVRTGVPARQGRDGHRRDGARLRRDRRARAWRELSAGDARPLPPRARGPA